NDFIDASDKVRQLSSSCILRHSTYEVPDDDRDSTDDHTGKRAFRSKLAPEQGKQDNRAESGTEPSPCISNQTKNGVVLFPRKRCSNNRDECDGKTAEHNIAFIAGLFLESNFIQIFNQGR